jgi:PAS domain S-box-containing protein
MASLPDSPCPIRVARACAVAVAVTGALCLIGYAIGLRHLASLAPGASAVAPNTALLLVLAGTALWLIAPERQQSGPAGGTARSRLGHLAGALVALFGLVVLAQHGAGVDAGIDRLLFADLAAQWRAGAVPGRPSPLAALIFVLVGLALTLLDVDAPGGHRPARLLVPATLLISVVAFLATVFGLTAPTGGTSSIAMSPQTAVAVLVLCVGILSARPSRPGVRAFTSEGWGGVTLRRLAPALLAAVAALVAFLAAYGATGAAVPGMRVTIAMTALVVLAYLALHHVGSALDGAGRRQQELVESVRMHEAFSETVLNNLDDGVAAIDAEGTVVRVSARWSEITGYPPEVALGSRPPFPWWPPERVQQREVALQELLHSTSRLEFDTQLVRFDGTRVDVTATTAPVRDRDGAVKLIICKVRDLSERNRAEAERRRLADQLDHLFAMSLDLMCVAGTDGYLKRVNPAWEHMFGYSPEELLGRPYIDFIHADDMPHTAELATALSERRTTSVAQETRFRHRDGTYRWINWIGTLAPDEDVIYAVGRDVTDLREAIATKARLAAIVESTDEAIVGKTLDGTITSWNPAAERIYGYRADEIVGRSIHLLMPPEERARYDEIMAGAAAGMPVKDHYTARIRKDGKQIQVELSVSPVRDASGAVVGEASISREITGRRHADERFRRLVVNAPVAMVIVDASGAISLINKETERLFGYTEIELIGRPVDQLVPHQLREQHAAHRREYLTAPVIRNMGTGQDLYGERKDGTQFPVEIGLAPLDTDEGTLVSAVIHDITDRKQVQHALAAARDNAVAAAQLRSQFVAMVSHEIRTPMNGVIGLTKLLLDTSLTEVQRRYADAVQTSARALLTIINDILDFSKIEAGKVRFTEVDFDLGALVEEVINVAAEASRGKSLEVIAYYPAYTPTAVRGDEGRIRQVLLNLIGNAIKFTETGEVVLRVEPARTGVPLDGDHAEAPVSEYTFSVTDTGIGIAPDDISRLFDAFTQADTTTSRQFGGTGLGLTISRQLVELMGGRLEVESRTGHGSRFSFTIPLATRPVAAHRLLAHSPLRGRRILIVDDNATSREMLAEHAASWGMAVTTVNTAEAALSRLLDAVHPDNRYDLAVLDQHMSGTDGLDLAEQIIGNTTLGNPIIILMASGHDSDERLAEHTGSVHVLPKPVGPSALYNVLVLVLDPNAARAAKSYETLTAADRPLHDRGPVLLAEDNDINQMVAMDTLAMLGYSADLARNGIEAIELATTKRYAAILMDCQMPKLDGFEATRELRRREPPGRHVPIIALTAGALTEDRQRCLDAGMDDYLAKPIDPEDLRTALERWTLTTA